MKKIINLPLYIKEQELLEDNSCSYQSYIIERDLYNDIKLVNEKHGTFDGQIEQFDKAVGDYKQDILDVFTKAIKETFK